MFLRITIFVNLFYGNFVGVGMSSVRLFLLLIGIN